MKRIDFYATLTEHNEVPLFYKTLIYSCNNSVYYKHNQSCTETENPVSIKLFPLYLKPEFRDNPSFEVKKVPQKKITGYAIDLKNTNNIDGFLTQEYSKSFRANIRRLKKRFEDCFTVSYKMFFGSISKEDYNFYMGELHKMLTIRFDQRNESNDILNNWSFYLESTYKMVLEKKASIFVIYENNIPVHVCINHHFNNILFVSIPSYDIDYSKFALGNISIYKLLEWALKNNYLMVDMAYGTLEYKRRWSNLIYDFEHHIIYDKSKFGQVLASTLEVNKIQLKNILKRYGFDEYVKKLKTLKNRKRTFPEEVSYKIEEVSETSTNNLEPIDIYSKEHASIKKIVFEFLYAKKAHIDELKLFKGETPNTFVIDHKNKTHLVAVIPTP
ncbi:GNAT family N-acetyltransferase [Tamlana crocina]|uniref:GNAT family N-acetyltransferase n=1 Tax=Tamlana crocina TaxID=393006 RepID=A0ABX1D9Y0_9FLAO|nr:GNAT family N-acetyltransferase [Tamlana crocina]NJX15174.1 GNAT family N-acetyltransferase [Tamlana crocina]